MPTPPYESIFQVIEQGLTAKFVETLSMESTVFNMHFIIHIIRLHDFNDTWLANKVNIGHPPLLPYSFYYQHLGSMIWAISSKYV